MKLSEFFERNYKNLREYENFKRKFPRLMDYAKVVEVIPWRKEFEVADRNPEIYDAIQYLKKLREKRAISEEEFKKKMEQLLPIGERVSKTLGIAFTERNEVSFREEVVPFWLAIHELGHCFFKKPDPVWSGVYGGGEQLLWTIASGFLQGNEETIRKYMEFLELIDENPKKTSEFLNSLAREILGNKGVKNVGGYALYSGYIPPKMENVIEPEEAPDYLSPETLKSILINFLEGVRWKDTFSLAFFGKFLERLERWRKF